MSLLNKYFLSKPQFREWITKVLYGSADTKVTLMGEDIHINALRENGYLRAARFSERSSLFRDEVAVLQNVFAVLRPNSTFVDVGANIGVHSVIVSRLTRLLDDFNVVAFEVDPNTFSRLKRNAALHGFAAHNIGVGEHKEDGVTYVRGAVSHVTTRTEHQNNYNIADRTFSSQIAPLVDLPVGDKPLFIKVDVEGAELAVLRGCAELMDQGRIYGFYFDGITEREESLSILSEAGFSIFDGRTLRPDEAPAFSVLALNS